MDPAELCAEPAWVMSVSMDVLDRYLVDLAAEAGEMTPEPELGMEADVRALMDEDTAEALVALRDTRVQHAVAQRSVRCLEAVWRGRWWVTS